MYLEVLTVVQLPIEFYFALATQCQFQVSFPFLVVAEMIPSAHQFERFQNA